MRHLHRSVEVYVSSPAVAETQTVFQIGTHGAALTNPGAGKHCSFRRHILSAMLHKDDSAIAFAHTEVNGSVFNRHVVSSGVDLSGANGTAGIVFPKSASGVFEYDLAGDHLFDFAEQVTHTAFPLEPLGSVTLDMRFD